MNISQTAMSVIIIDNDSKNNQYKLWLESSLIAKRKKYRTFEVKGFILSILGYILYCCSSDFCVDIQWKKSDKKESVSKKLQK